MNDATGCGLCGVFLSAAASLDHALLQLARPDAVIARHGSHFGHDGQLAKASLDFVEGQADLRAARGPGGIDAADVPDNHRAWWQIVSLAGLERLQRAHVERLILMNLFRIEIAFQPNQETRAGYDGKRLDG